MISAPVRGGRDEVAPRGHHPPPRRTGAFRRPVSPRGPALPPIVTVFRREDGTICHTWCGQPLELQGRRAALEVDFYCQHCVEHVALPECVLPRIPVGAAGRRPPRPSMAGGRA